MHCYGQVSRQPLKQARLELTDGSNRDRSEQGRLRERVWAKALGGNDETK